MPEKLDKNYIDLQIAASEALRSAGDLSLTAVERRKVLLEAEGYAARALSAAPDENVFLRYLALSQYTCATGMRLLSEAAGPPYRGLTPHIRDLSQEVRDEL